MLNRSSRPSTRFASRGLTDYLAFQEEIKRPEIQRLVMEPMSPTERRIFQLKLKGVRSPEDLARRLNLDELRVRVLLQNVVSILRDQFEQWQPPSNLPFRA